eukprot:3630520-Rhodomonas_salina.1
MEMHWRQRPRRAYDSRQVCSACTTSTDPTENVINACMRGQAHWLKAQPDANLKACPSRPRWVPSASRYVQVLNWAYFNPLKWCWEVVETVIDSEANEQAIDPTTGHTTEEGVNLGSDGASDPGTVPPWIESDQAAKDDPAGGKAGSRGGRPASTHRQVNVRLHQHQADYYGPRDGDWWQQQDEWGWARAQMPETYINPQRTVPGDWVTVR